jgi:hypothetical protein
MDTGARSDTVESKFEFWIWILVWYLIECGIQLLNNETVLVSLDTPQRNIENSGSDTYRIYHIAILQGKDIKHIKRNNERFNSDTHRIYRISIPYSTGVKPTKHDDEKFVQSEVR